MQAISCSWAKKASILLLSVLVTGCSGSKTMDSDTAAKEIKGYMALDQNTVQADIGRVGTDCVLPIYNGSEISIDLSPLSNPQAIAVEALGYISVAPDGPGFWKVSLTEKGEAVVQSKDKPEPPKNGCNYQTVSFPAASPELIRITGVTANEEEPKVDYMWKWNYTDLGRALRRDGKAYAALNANQRARLADLMGLSKRHKLPVPAPPEDYSTISTVKFKKYTDGWRLP